MRVLTVNAGSSSVKLRLVGDDDEELWGRELTAPEARLDPGALARALTGQPADADAIAHRVVHGGERFRRAVRLDASVAAQLRELTSLAPLHQPKSLAALDAVSALLPSLPAVACFDTAFHSTLDPGAFTYALPAEWRERWGLRRFGFHGLSHSWIARRVEQLLGADGPGRRIVSCHLGAGASLCAIRAGVSVDTTMGFTPLEGLVMATRSGSVDPGMLLWLLEREEISEREMASALEHRSGLAGLAGTGDMREIVRRSERGDGPAALALDVYIHRLRAGIAAMAAALGGLDVLVFTGGVGENAADIRQRTAEGLAFMGVGLQVDGSQPPPDREIGRSEAPVKTLVVRAREDAEMAHQARQLLSR